MPTNMSWRDAIIKVLEQASGSMHYTQIADEILSRGLRADVGATPAITVNSVITQDINNYGDDSLFVRTDRGYYMLRPKLSSTDSNHDDDGESTIVAVEPRVEEAESSIINAFGMYWRRDLVFWDSSPRLWGRQSVGSTIVDFAAERGVYLLHDHRGVVYVGRASDQTLGARLLQHTTDRLNGRWDRFSWFGVDAVTDEGKLRRVTLKEMDVTDWIAAMEALLIETLEPPQNRKRGDDFRAAEYLQVEDDRLRNKRLAQILAEVQSHLNLP